jgi:spermidine/putrescine-binding protein
MTAAVVVAAAAAVAVVVVVAAAIAAQRTNPNKLHSGNPLPRKRRKQKRAAALQRPSAKSFKVQIPMP